MKKDENFFKKIHATKADKYKADIVHFGYTITGEARKGDIVILTVNKEPSALSKKLAYYEKQYNLINKKTFPVASFVLIGLGLVALVLMIMFAKTNAIISLVSMILMGIFFALAVFSLLAFIILKSKCRKLTVEILKRCDQLQGYVVSDLMLDQISDANPLPPEEDPENHIIK